MHKFASFLSEASLTFGEITRDDREFRLELFLRKYKGNESFTLTDGSEIVLKYNAEIERALKAKDSKTASSIGLETMAGEKIAFGKLSKTAEFGGGRGSGGGSASTTATESAQCVYLQAIWDNPQTKFSPDDLRNAYTKVFVNATVDQILLGDDAWISSSIDTARMLHKVLKKKTYSFHRGSDWVNTLDNHYKRLNRVEKAFSNLNKWNPADIWLVAKGAESKYDFDGAQSLQYLNNELLKAFAARDIVGVSLKKVASRPRLTQVNYKAPFKSPTFSSVSYGKKDFFKSKDGYLFGSGGLEMQFRTFPTFQCEIIGKAAKHGKVSHGPIDSALYATNRNKTENRRQLESSIKSDREGFLDKFYGFYTSAVLNPVDREKFGENLKGKTIEWLVSKYYVTTIFTMVKGREQMFMDYLYRLAKSQSKLSSVHLKVQ
jgi:hypothetical protein